MAEIDITRDPTLLTPSERVAAIIDIRSRISARQPVSDDEIKYGVRLIRLDRDETGRARAAAKETKSSAPTLSLADFANLGK